jgi:hypothetical protein
VATVYQEAARRLFVSRFTGSSLLPRGVTAIFGYRPLQRVGPRKTTLQAFTGRPGKNQLGKPWKRPAFPRPP